MAVHHMMLKVYPVKPLVVTPMTPHLTIPYHMVEVSTYVLVRSDSNFLSLAVITVSNGLFTSTCFIPCFDLVWSKLQTICCMSYKKGKRKRFFFLSSKYSLDHKFAMSFVFATPYISQL